VGELATTGEFVVSWAFVVATTVAPPIIKAAKKAIRKPKQRLAETTLILLLVFLNCRKYSGVLKRSISFACKPE
jgi:hypothetical protein